MRTLVQSVRRKNKPNKLAWFFGIGALFCLFSILWLLVLQRRLTNYVAHIGPPIDSQQVLLAPDTPFEKLAADSPLVKNAIQATDIATAKSKIGTIGAFVGTVSTVRPSSGNTKLVLNFARQHDTAMRAIVRPPSFNQFPDLKQLVGKKVWVYGVFAPHQTRAEIELTQSKQIKVVE